MPDSTPPRMSYPRTPTGVAELAALDPAGARELLRSTAYWRALFDAPELHVSPGRVPAQTTARWFEPPASAKVREHARAQLAGEGYLCWPRLVRADRCAALARAVISLCRQGWDAALLAVCDEAWSLALELAQVMNEVLGPDMLFRRELFGFCVDPSLAAGRPRGVPAHRDRPDSGYVLVDGVPLPRHCTCWVALTETDEANGCMRVVPAAADDAHAHALAASESLPSRALSVPAGSVLAWSGQLVHWGGRYDGARARGPRVALAFSMTHAEVPSRVGLDAVRPDSLPSFAERLAVVATLLGGLQPPAPGSAMEVVLGLLRGER